MTVISMYDAKTNFSKLVKRAQAGETIYVGAYGQAQAVIAPLPTGQKKPLRIGILAHKRVPNDGLDDPYFVKSDPEIVALFEESINKPF